MDLENNLCQEKQGKPPSVGEKDTFNSLENSDEVDELMKTVNDSTENDAECHISDVHELMKTDNDTENDAECHTSAVHEQDFNYMDELLSYIGDVDQDGVENIENNNEEDSELTNLLEEENNSDSAIDRFVIRDIISPMSIDSGIELGSDSTKSSNQPGQNYNQGWSFLDPSYSITPSSSPVLRSSTPGFEPDYYSTSRSNTPTSHSSSSTSRSNTPTSHPSSSTSRSNTPTSHPSSSTSRSNTPNSHPSSLTFNSKLLESTTNSCISISESISESITSCLNPSAVSSNTSPSNSNPSAVSSNPSSTTAISSLSCLNPSTTISNFPPPSPSSLVTISKSCALRLNPSQSTFNSPVSGPNPSANWKVEIIHKSERGNPYKEREKAYWRKRKREDKNQSVKRKKVLWSHEKPQRSYKKECSSSHYSYEEEDDFDDLYLFSDMVGVNPGEASDSSEDSDTSDEESEDEAVEIEECMEPLAKNRLLVEEDRCPRFTSSVFLTSNTQDGTIQNSSINPNHTLYDPHLLDDLPIRDDADFLDDPPIHDEPNVSHHNVDTHKTNDTSKTPPSPATPIQSNNSNQFCDLNNISPELATYNSPNISPELDTSRPSRKRKCPFPSEPSSTVIIPELKLDVEEDAEKSVEKAASLTKLRTLRPRSVVETKKEVFKKPEVPENPRCLTKRSRNRDRKVKLYEKGKMANEKDEARRLRALQVKLNRDRIKFEGIRRVERLKELEKENVMLREEMEKRKVREYEGEKRRVDLEDALEVSRKREEELKTLLEEAKKREEELINEVKEREKREEGLGEVDEVGNGAIGKEAVNPQVQP